LHGIVANHPKPSESSFSLAGKVAVVTGASRGIGAAIGARFKLAGATVVGLARSASPAQSIEFEYRSCDVTDHAAFRALCDAVVSSRGRLDILVNAAGISEATPGQAQPVTAFERTIAVDLVAPFACCMAAAHHMRSGGGGSIINVTSIGSIEGFPDNPAYAAAKGGLRMMTKALAVDLGRFGIRVNNLVPGYIHTSMTAESHADPVRHADRLRHMIVPRWGTAEDLVGAAVFLASDAAAYVTGSDLVVDGGWLAKGLT
jgi:NAD(P)-dependent dehydrogenase (short-subunit alcohol dehydrogenase family)